MDSGTLVVAHFGTSFPFLLLPLFYRNVSTDNRGFSSKHETSPVCVCCHNGPCCVFHESLRTAWDWSDHLSPVIFNLLFLIQHGCVY